MSYEESKTETEILNTDEQKIREMCCTLKRVDAPKDFEFKLKARIANSSPRDFKPRFGWAFRYALPVLALIFAAGFLAFNGGIFSASNNGPIAAVSSPQTINPSLPQNTMVAGFGSTNRNENADQNPVSSNSPQNLLKVSENEVAINPKSPKIVEKPKVKSDNFNRSELKSSRPPEIIEPLFGSNSVPQRQPNLEKTTSLPVKEILAQFGIDAAFENNKWIVKSVVQNGVAESSGIKENDVVEAIDNQTISNESLSAKTLNFKNITVVRSGGKLEIKLRNKQ